MKIFVVKRPVYSSIFIAEDQSVIKPTEPFTSELAVTRMSTTIWGCLEKLRNQVSGEYLIDIRLPEQYGGRMHIRNDADWIIARLRYGDIE